MVWNPTRYLWQWQVKGPKKEVWRLLADTARLRYAFGLTAGSAELTLTRRKKAGQPSLILQSLLGNPKEIPCDWIEEKMLHLHMRWPSGSFACLHMELEFKEEDGVTFIRQHVRVTPANPLGKALIPFVFGKMIRKRLAETFVNIERFIENNGDMIALASFSPLTDEGLEQLDEGGKALVADGFRATWVKPLIQMISLDSDSHLKSIAPFSLIEKWGMPRKRIVELFLAATEKKLLRIQWQLRCPKCLKSHVIKTSLEEIQNKGHCPKCDVYFQNNLARNVELTFAPDPRIREVHPKMEIERGPASNPQAIMKQTLDPHEVRIIDQMLPPGQFRIRTDLTKPEQWVTAEFATDGTGEISLEVGKETIKVHLNNKEGNKGVRIGNRTDVEQTIWVENLSVKQEALTALRATSYQHFRTLFRKEVMLPTEIIEAGSLTLLKIEIVDSGSLFRRKGNTPAFLLLKEFEAFLEQIVDHHDGAIVRNEGDGLLAVFLEPEKGALAALTMNQDMDTFNATLPEAERITIRLAVHQGECLAINMNNHLDYFGDAVNLVGHLPSECQERDVVFSEEICGDAGVAKILKQETIDSEEVNTALPDFSEQLAIRRVKGRLQE